MSALLTAPITSPAAWTAADFATDESWIHHLSREAINSIDTALINLSASGKTFPHFTKDDFPIGAFAQDLAHLTHDLENGRGFFLLRGLPVAKYSDDDIACIYYGLGLHLGTPVGQNLKGDLIGTVMNVGDLEDKNTRVYETNLYLPYHTDPSDVFCLLCLRQARTGGLSSLVSAAAIYNEILEHHPTHLGLYYRPFHYAHLGKNEPGRSPIFSYHDGKLSCRYLRQYIELGHDLREQPISTVEREALDIFDAVSQADHMRLDMMLEPGDMQFANNYAVLHSRSAFEDFEEQEKRRKLLRLWIKMPNARALAPEFPGRNGFPVPANRYPLV